MRGWVVAAVPIGLVISLAGGGPSERPRRLAPTTRASGELTAGIDAALERAWREAGVTPGPEVDDLAFARRVWLDLLGTIPSLAEVRAIQALSAAAPSRAAAREALVDRALADPRFSWALAERLAQVAVGADARPDDLLYRRRRLVSWLAEQVERQRPWDALVRELITARGLSTDSPAANFVLSQDRDPIKLAARTTRAFLGVRIDCAQCHDHPFTDWTRAQFEGVAAFFSEVDADLGGVRDRPGRPLWLDATGAVVPGGEGGAGAMAMGDGDGDGLRRVEPGVPFGPELLPAGALPTRRQALAAWVTHPDNPYFARAIANRIWTWLLGVGLVEPVDELDTTRPRLPELLDLLGRDLAEHRFDLERLIRAIATSRAYARASRAEGEDEAPERARRLWASYSLQRLRGPQLGAALFQATSFWTWDRRRNQVLRMARFFALEEVTRRHGDDLDAEAPEDETLLQRLLLMNGEQLHQRLKDDDPFGPITRIPLLSPDDGVAIETAFLMTLTRLPTPEERAWLLDELRAAGPRQEDRAAFFANLMWAQVNSTEFGWKH